MAVVAANLCADTTIFHCVIERGDSWQAYCCRGYVGLTYETIAAHDIPLPNRCTKQVCARAFRRADQEASDVPR